MKVFFPSSVPSLCIQSLASWALKGISCVLVPGKGVDVGRHAKSRPQPRLFPGLPTGRAMGKLLKPRGVCFPETGVGNEGGSGVWPPHSIYIVLGVTSTLDMI